MNKLAKLLRDKSFQGSNYMTDLCRVDHDPIGFVFEKLDDATLDLAISNASKLEGLEVFSKIRLTSEPGGPSLRSLRYQIFLLNTGKEIGRGIQKVAKLAYKLIHCDGKWESTPIAYVKDKKRSEHSAGKLENHYMDGITHPNLETIGHIYKLYTTDVIGTPAAKYNPERTGYFTELALGDLFEWRDKLTKKELVKVMIDIASGVKALHDEGRVHQDLKPENFYIYPKEDGTYRGKIGDCTNVTAHGCVQRFGTPTYLAPENVDPKTLARNLRELENQRLLDAYATKQTDIYALGLSLAMIGLKFEGLANMTSRYPAERPTINEVIRELERIDSILNRSPKRTS